MTPEEQGRGILGAAAAWFCACVAGALLWAQFRGFDLLDGGYYFLLYQDPGDNPDTHTRFDAMARPVWSLCQQDIATFRLACLGAASAACWVFWRAFRRHLLAGPGGPAGWSLWLATMAGLTWVPVALTYNSLSTIFALLGLALLLALGGRVERTDSVIRALAPPAAAAAAVAFLLYLAKPPAAAAFVACSVFLLLFSVTRGAGRRRLLAWVLLGLAAAAFAAVVVLGKRPASADLGLHVSVNGGILTPAWAWANLVRYSHELRSFLPSLGADLLWTIGPTIFACLAVIIPGARRYAAGAFGLLLLAVAAASIERRLWDCSFSAAVSGEAARFYLVFWCALLPLWAACKACAGHDSSAKAPGCLPWITVLFALPLISSFGSTNTPYVSALHAVVFWAAGLLLAADQISATLQMPWFRSAVAALLCVGAAGHVFSGHFLKPYMYQPSLWNQTESVAIGSPVSTLKVDPALAEFISTVRGTMKSGGFRPGDDVFGFFNLPGVIYAVGARQPGAPWYFGTWYHQDDTDGAKLRRVSPERRQRAWILTQADVTRFRPEFVQSGIDFPNGYLKIGQAINPTTGLEIGIWKPVARH